MVLYYHYTTKAGLESIEADGYIEQSPQSASFRKGVYCTKLPPKTGKIALAKRIRQGLWEKVLQEGKYDCGICFDIEESDVELCSAERCLYICRKRVYLSDYDCRFFYLDEVPVTFYHYTDKKGKDAIIKSGSIKRSNGVFGKGVYGTTMSPKEGREQVCKNNWDGDRYWQTMMNKGRANFAICVRVPSPKVERVNNKRNIWIHNEELQLTGYNWHLEQLDGTSKSWKSQQAEGNSMTIEGVDPKIAAVYQMTWSNVFAASFR